MNGDTAACLSTCEVASCGDGFVQAGVEGCDEGDKNADTAACLSTCKVASCGDGFVQAGVEQCDGGAPANGMCQACKLTCNQDFQDCNMSAGDGCEVALCGGTCQNPGMPKGMKAFNYTGQIENFVVPACVKAVTIEGWGAQGGDNPPLVGAGGKGARIKGTFVVAGGDTLKIVVGQMGAKPANSNVANGGAGGGGGSFVWRGNNELLLVAGGGGGSCLQNNGLPHYLGKDGVVGQDGTGSRSHDINNNAPGGTAGGDGKSVTPSGGKGWNSVLVNPAGGSVCQQYGPGAGVRDTWLNDVCFNGTMSYIFSDYGLWIECKQRRPSLDDWNHYYFHHDHAAAGDDVSAADHDADTALERSHVDRPLQLASGGCPPPPPCRSRPSPSPSPPTPTTSSSAAAPPWLDGRAPGASSTTSSVPTARRARGIPTPTRPRSSPGARPSNGPRRQPSGRPARSCSSEPPTATSSPTVRPSERSAARSAGSVPPWSSVTTRGSGTASTPTTERPAS